MLLGLHHRGLTTMLLMLLLFRYSAKNLNAQEVRLVTSPQLVTRLHLQNAIVVRLHVYKTDNIILT